MIAKLKGIVDSINEDSVVLDVNGVCYQVYVSLKVKSELNVGEHTALQIYHIFKPEQQYLCGFKNSEEMCVFKTLLDVHGVGIKSSLSVLSVLSTQELAIAVATQDSSILCRASGIGKKTAARILLELKDKTIIKMRVDAAASDGVSDGSVGFSDNVNDAILGLISLGYQKNIVTKTIMKIVSEKGSDLSANELIVHCLREI